MAKIEAFETCRMIGSPLSKMYIGKRTKKKTKK